MKTVAVDLDGVLAQYDGWKGVEHIGEPIDGAREFLLAIKSLPARICIHTTRANAKANKGHSKNKLRQNVADWLSRHKLPYDLIECDGKPLASAYVDDRAVVCRPNKDAENQDYDTALRMCRALVNGHELGSQGTYSHGRLNDEDEGDIKMMITSDDGVVRIDFGKPVGWLGLPPSMAVNFARLILKHAERVS